MFGSVIMAIHNEITWPQACPRVAIFTLYCNALHILVCNAKSKIHLQKLKDHAHFEMAEGNANVYFLRLYMSWLPSSLIAAPILTHHPGCKRYMPTENI